MVAKAVSKVVAKAVSKVVAKVAMKVAGVAALAAPAEAARVLVEVARAEAAVTLAAKTEVLVAMVAVMAVMAMLVVPTHCRRIGSCTHRRPWSRSREARACRQPG